MKRAEIKARLDELAAREVVEPTGEFDMIVIDPPWPSFSRFNQCSGPGGIYVLAQAPAPIKTEGIEQGTPKAAPRPGALIGKVMSPACPSIQSTGPASTLVPHNISQVSENGPCSG